ncbi:MAG: outer membrane protein assembly factor BamD [Steroidobacteraceae bacterium]
MAILRYSTPSFEGLHYIMRSFTLARSMALALCLSCTLLSGCQLLGHRKRAKQATPEILYKEAHRALDDYNYKGAIKVYEALVARFPFTDQARQASIDLIYAYYRDGESDSATDAADTFIRQNPTHPRVDYAWYIKGLVYFPRSENLIERLFHADLSKRPPNKELKSFDAFRTVVRLYPKSAYAYDAHQRMIYLRDRLADYDVHVANYYMRRGAYVGAVRRANECIEQYAGAPAVKQALEIMIDGYGKLGLKQRADQARAVYQLNYPHQAMRYTDHPHRWWRFW